MRQREGAVLCSQCNRLVHVSERTCPHCGAPAPGLFGFAPALRRVFGDADFSAVIVAVCVTLYVASLLIDVKGALAQALGGSWSMLDFGSPSSRALYTLGMTGGYSWAKGQWWTLLTANYLHGSALHIAFNMMWTRQLGPAASRAFGPARFFILWTLTGMAGFLLSVTFSRSPTIGASAAIFGLMGALVAFGRRRGGTLGDGLSRQVMVWAGVGFLFGFMVPNVNNFAHLGGFVAGLALGAVMPLEGRSREGRLTQLTALALAAATAVALLASVATNHALLSG